MIPHKILYIRYLEIYRSRTKNLKKVFKIMKKNKNKKRKNKKRELKEQESMKMGVKSL